MSNSDQPTNLPEDSTVTEIGAGAQFGPYVVEARLGAGGMGQVFRARDTRLGRGVALKVSNANFSDRFGREARAIAALNHPHICTLHDVGPNYLVMELVEGAPLRGPLAEDKAIEFAGQILDAIDAAHRKGITHRDLKPSNILVCKSGIKVLDFGLADIAGDPQLTKAGAVMGTPAYMAPEQWEGKEADARSDIYSFGCVLYEMLTGKRAAKTRVPVAGAALESVIATCLEIDPEDRWQSARDIKRALTLPAVTAPTRRSTQWWVAPAALIVIGLGAWALSRLGQPGEQEPVRRLQITPPSGGHFAIAGNGNVGGLALSPDGKAAAYVATVAEQTALWVQPLDGTPRLLAGTDSAAFPFWSPDGKSIAFMAKGKLQRVDAASGTLSTVTQGPSFGGTWLDDGRIVFAKGSNPLFQVSASGGSVTPLTELDASRGEVAHEFPQSLPGGGLLYQAQSNTPENSAVYAISLARPTEKIRVLKTAANALYASGYLLWWNSGTLMAQGFDPIAFKLSGEAQPLAQQVTLHSPDRLMNVATSGNGLLLYDASGFQRKLRWFDSAGRLLGPAGDMADVRYFRISSDGRRVAVSAGDPTTEDTLWVVDENGLSSRLTSDREGFLRPLWSPNGFSLIVPAGTPSNLFRMDASGAGARERVTTSPNIQFATDWSRDGRFVLYYDNAPGTQRDLLVLPMTMEGKPVDKPRIYLQTPANESWAQFSPEQNPRWVVYQSDQSGRFEIYLQAFPNPGRQIRISEAGGSYPKWGADGLYYMSAQNKLVLATLRLGADSVEVMARRELMVPVPPAQSGAGSPPFDVTPDGQRFLVRTEERSTEALTVVTNWPALLRKGK